MVTKSTLFDLIGLAGFGGGGRRRRPGGASPGSSRAASAQSLRGAADDGAGGLQEFLVDSSRLQADVRPAVLPYCCSRRLDDRVDEGPTRGAAWGSFVIGVEDEDGDWLRCGEVFLPMAIGGIPVVTHRQYPPVLVPRRLMPKPRPKAKAKPALKRNSGTSENTRLNRGEDAAGVGDLDEVQPMSPASASSADAVTALDEEAAGKDQVPAYDSGFHSHSSGEELSPDSQAGAVSGKAEVRQAWEAQPEEPNGEELVEKESIRVRLPALAPSHWLAPGGMGAPHIEPSRYSPDDLQESALRGDVSLVRKLIQAGVSVNAPIRALCDDEFLTLLHVLACRPHTPNGTRTMVELLESRANPNVRSSLGSTPLIFACLHKNMSAVQVLLDAGAQASPVDDHGRTAVRCAMIPDPEVSNSAHLSVQLAEMLGLSGAPLDEGGLVAPIVEAVMQHNSPAVRKLVELGATPDGLSEAVLNAPVPMIRDLIEAEANPFTRDATGKTVMEVALSRGEDMVTTMLRDYIGDLERSGHPHLQSRSGPTENFDAAMDTGRSRSFFERDLRMKKDRVSLVDRMVERENASIKPMNKSEKIKLKVQQVCKRICRNRVFQALMVFILFLALFSPDFWIIGGMSDPTPLDILIICIFGFFFFEFSLQVAGLRGNYVFKFPFWIDIIGLLSVPLDHSVVTELILNSFEDVDSTALARIARLVKLGARAGRLSRLVKLLRFLPGIRDKDGTAVGTAKKMSKTINMMLSIQVVCLIIIMVIALPVMEIFRYPQNDHSMEAWANLIDVSAFNFTGNDTDDLYGMISSMEEFYSSFDYFPFEVYCTLGDGSSWNTSLAKEGPTRKEDTITIAAGADGRSKVLFNFRKCNVVEAICTMTLILTVIFIMFSASMLVSSSVASIVLTPLERLLTVVKDVAANIFFSVDKLAKQVAGINKAGRDDPDSDSDDDADNEAKMLEKVLKKLSAMSELTVKRSPIDGLDKLGKEVTAMLADFNINAFTSEEGAEGATPTTGIAQIINVGQEREHHTWCYEQAIPTLQDAGIDRAAFQTWQFDITALTPPGLEAAAAALMKLYQLSGKATAELPEATAGMTAGKTDRSSGKSAIAVTDSSGLLAPANRRMSLASRRASQQSTRRRASFRRNSAEDIHVGCSSFVSAVAASYADPEKVPYHNFAHAVDVTFTLHRALQMCCGNYLLMPHERLALMASALGHDIGHQGVDNPYLIHSGAELAIMYNDSSPLENMHCSKMFEIMNKPGITIFAPLEPALVREVRRICVIAILHTDNQRHFSMIKNMEMMYDMNTELFDTFGGPDHDDGRPPVEVVDFFFSGKDNHRRLPEVFFLHFSDLSNSMKDWKQCQIWSDRLFQEFFAQGDKEVELGLPVQALRRRDTVNLPDAQLSIIELCVMPLLTAATKIFPGLGPCKGMLLENMQNLHQKWMETDPSKEELAKREKFMSKLKGRASNASKGKH